MSQSFLASDVHRAVTGDTLPTAAAHWLARQGAAGSA
ncbi:phosphotransferase, partial [Acidithiobacillus ferridurans]|nr:phosphotransferase [Acidithiobacillus ferridurans]